MSISERQVNNGVNVQALLDARKALSDAPEAAKFQWRASCKWINGTHSHSTIRNFFGLGGEQKDRTEFSFDAGIAAVAQNRGIQLRSVAATIEGSMDMQGILGIDQDVRNGFDGIKVKYQIDADATPDEIKALVAQSQKRSAVFDIITNPTSVSVEVN